MGQHFISREKKSKKSVLSQEKAGKKTNFLKFMNQEKSRIGIVGPNKRDIIGYLPVTLKPDGSVASFGQTVEVNLSVAVHGLDIGILRANVPTKIFDQLKYGPESATVQLSQVNPRPNLTEVTTHNLPNYSNRQSAFDSRLGTAGKRKFLKQNGNGKRDIESRLDVAKLAVEKCGKKSKLEALYDWTEENIYSIVNGQKISISSISTWKESIRQNVKQARASLSESKGDISEAESVINAELDHFFKNFDEKKDDLNIVPDNVFEACEDLNQERRNSYTKLHTYEPCMMTNTYYSDPDYIPEEYY